MKNLQLAWRFLVVLTLAGLLVGCGSPTATATPTAAPTTAPTTAPTMAPTVAPTKAPTVDLQPTFNAVKTQAAATVIANLTQTAPTATTAPSATPTGAGGATATKPASTSAATATSQPKATTPILTPWTVVPTKAAYNCTVTGSSPKKGETFPPSSNFDVKFTVVNTGATKWMPSETVLRFVDGEKMQKFGDALLLSKEVLPNETFIFGIDMVAPASAGTYNTSWRLTYGGVTICSMGLQVVIK